SFPTRRSSDLVPVRRIHLDEDVDAGARVRGSASDRAEQSRIRRTVPVEEFLELITTRDEELAHGERLGRQEVLGHTSKIPARVRARADARPAASAGCAKHGLPSCGMTSTTTPGRSGQTV